MNKLRIKVFDRGTFINYLVSHNIFFDCLEEYKDYYILNVNYDNYKKISRRYETIILKYYGKEEIILFIKNNKFMIISIIVSLFFLILLSQTIFDIKVNTSSIELKNIILSSLKENGIDIGKRKRSFKEINNIKNKILSENKDKLEWIEIRNKGSKYIIDLTPRVNENKNIDNKISSIIASKDGVIKHINITRGTKMKELGEYVKKGEVIISGNIIKDDNVIDITKASGEVYAEVWYFVNVTVPFKYEEKVYTGESINHLYLEFLGKKITLMGKYESPYTENKTKLLIDKPYLFFKLYNERKKIYKNKVINIDENVAYKLALSESESKIKSKLKNGEYIISKNVLKKEVNSSKMYIEVFFKVYESIGVSSEIEKIIKKDE